MRRTSSPGTVGPAVCRLGARAGHEALVVAVQQAVELADDRELELAQGSLGSSPRRARWRGSVVRS